MAPKVPPAKRASIASRASTSSRNSNQSRTDSVVTLEKIYMGRARSRFMSISSTDTDWDEIAEQLNRSLKRKPSTSFNVEEATKLSNELIRAFRPLELFMKIMLRFPLTRERVVAEGSYYFQFKKLSFQTIGFLFTGFVFHAFLFFMIINLFGYALNYPKAPAYGQDSSQGIRAFELYIFTRNAIPVLMILTNLIHTCFALTHFFGHREFAAKCMTFWTQAAGILKMDLGEGVRKYMMIVVVTYCTIWIILIVFTVSQIIPVGTGAPGIFAYLMGRVFSPHLFMTEEFYIVRGFFAFWMIYMCISSKVYIIMYIFQCRILANAFNVWNERLDRVLHWGGMEEAVYARFRATMAPVYQQVRNGESEDPPRRKSENRTGFYHLFKDHVCLLDMLEGADTLFGYTVVTYYLGQVTSLCFEIYYFFRTQLAKGEFHEQRTLDGIYMFFYLAQSIFILYVVSMSAANVGETAMEGLEILRKKGLVGRNRTSEDYYFILSMYMSFDGHFDTALTAGKFFVFDNGTLITLLGTIFSYFIILIQFSPRLTYFPVLKTESEYLSELSILRVLENFEGSWEIWPTKLSSMNSMDSNITMGMNSTMTTMSLNPTT